jgi:hypothetical protein
MPGLPTPIGANIFSVFDDTPVTLSGASDSEKKNVRFIINPTFSPVRSLLVSLSGSSNNGSYIAYFKFSIDGGAIGSSLILSTNITTETALVGFIDVSGLSTGIHTLHMYMNGGNASGIASNSMLGIYGRP